MKKYYTLLFMCMMALSMRGTVVITFIPGEETGIQPAVVGYENRIVKDGVEIYSTSPAFNSSQFRFAQGSETTVTSLIGNIIEIEFHCSAMAGDPYGPDGFKASSDFYYCEDKMGIWTGAATCVEFTAISAVRATKIVVTVDDTAMKPVISPAGGTYFAPVEVTMTCSTQGAQIHYTVDGSNPTASSPVYAAPFTLTSDAVINAVAVKDGEMGPVVRESYRFLSQEDVPDIAAATALPDQSTVRFTGPVIVLAQNRYYLYVKDDSGCALIYGDTGQTYLTGDVIPAGFVVTKVTYSGEPELKVVGGFEPALERVDISPQEITADQVGHDLFAHYVLIKDALLQSDDGRNFTLTDAQGNSCAVYFGTMGMAVPYDLTRHYDILGIVGSYGRDSVIYQLLPVGTLVPGYDFTLCDLFDVQDGTIITFNHEVTVLAQADRYLYLREENGCHGLAYGNTGQTYSTGDIIPAGWGGTKATWSGMPELMNPVGFESAIRHETVIPEEITIGGMSTDAWAHYVIIRHVMIDFSRKVLIDADGNEIPFTTQGITLPEATGLIGPCDVTGIVTVYRDTCGLLLLDYEPKQVPTPVKCLGDLEGLTAGTLVRFETPLTAIYQNGRYLYVADSCGVGGLLYGDGVGGPFNNGYLITGVARIVIYNERIQLEPVGEWMVVGVTSPVQPMKMPIEEVSHDMVNWFVGFDNVWLDEYDQMPYIADETGEMAVYDRFGADTVTVFIGDYNEDQVTIAQINSVIDYIISDNEPHMYHQWSAEGFLNVYRGNLEFYPVRFVHHIRIEHDINGDGEVNIADVNRIVEIDFSNDP